MNNDSIVLGHFLPSSLLQQLTPLRRLTSTSSDSGDSGVGPVEEAFIIYDRYSGRHRGFGFVTFSDMATTKAVCSTRIFNLHGRKIECKQALKREEFWLIRKAIQMITNLFVQVYNASLSPPPPVPSLTPMPANIQMCPSSIPLSYGQYRQSSPTSINALGGWIVNPSMQAIPPMFQPMFNPHQQYVPLSTIMWNDPYQQATIQSPFIQIDSVFCGKHSNLENCFYIIVMAQHHGNVERTGADDESSNLQHFGLLNPDGGPNDLYSFDTNTANQPASNDEQHNRQVMPTDLNHPHSRGTN
ncbi:unnamed protein product [Rotaria sp. Silwood2]|nr:unnamed protein product [Rotaria sp. Silwood2]CAF4562037.1 unnamed protein product [Rotaria sp. Silwood2]